jgi:CRISPR-associated protein Cmr3
MSANRIEGLLLQPLDVLFCRGGRPFGAAARVESGLPLPQTFAGALTTALLGAHGCDFEPFGNSVRQGMNPTEAIRKHSAAPWIADIGIRGPWLARTDEGSLDVFTPVPASLCISKNGDKKKLRLLPLIKSQIPPGWDPPAPGMRPLWCKESAAVETATGYLGGKALRAFLSGSAFDGAVVPSNALYEIDERTGIEIDAERLTAAEGQIFNIGFLSLARGVCLYAEVILPEQAPEQALAVLHTLALGGEGKRVAVQQTPRFEWGEKVDRTARPFLMLTTPGLFEASWKPKVLDGRIIAAASPGPVPLSGWDLAKRGPKPTRFAAAPGTIYFLDQLPDNLPASLCDSPEDGAQGYGCYVKGVWTDA